MQTPHRDGFENLAIHAGQRPDPYRRVVRRYTRSRPGSRMASAGCAGRNSARPRAGSRATSIRGPTTRPGARSREPVALESGVRGLVFASGMAASDCLLRAVCKPGDHVLIPNDAYGGTFRLFDKVLAGWGVTYQPVTMADTSAVRAARCPDSASHLGGDAD